MHSIITQVCPELACRPRQEWIVVNVLEMALGSIGSKPRIELLYPWPRIDIRSPVEGRSRGYTAQDHFNSVGTGDLSHRHNVVLEVLGTGRAGVARNIIGACQD